MDKKLTCLGAVLGWAFVVVTATILTGLVLQQLWAWFIVRTFGLPALSVPVALGVSTIVGMLTRQAQSDTKKEENTTKVIARAVASAYSEPPICLVFGWVIQSFIR